jgi:ubiquinone/menaquinone biosynthesis C-methylase UbiE
VLIDGDIDEHISVEALNMKNFSGTEFSNKAVGFNQPTQLPRDDAQRRQWQSANRDWWEATPMRYDWRDEIPEPPGTKAYFTEIDRRFLASARKYMPWRNIPFDSIIPFEELLDKDVLEIGVGQGTHALLLAGHSRSFTGIDLTSHAAETTKRRLELFKFPGKVVQMDAEDMDFADNSFDFVWSWGVIHHSADTRQVLKEMSRVLRPGGKCAVMIYHRSWWYFYICALLKGLVQGQLRSQGSLHAVNQSATDGAIARYYTRREWEAMSRDLFTVESTQIYGLKTDVIPLPYGPLKRFVEHRLPDGFSRFLTNKLRMGSFLVVQMRKG